MSWTGIFIVLLIFFVVLLLIVVAGALAAFLGRKKLRGYIYEYLKPAPTTIEQDLKRLLSRFPDSSVDEITDIYIKEESRFLAGVGALTIIPILGFFIDISYTTLRQMRMLHVITALYKNDKLDPEKLEMKYMGIVGGVNLVIRLILKGPTSEIPILSALINAGLNWWFTQKIGRAGIGFNKEQGLWETTKLEAGEMKGWVLGAKEAALDAIHLAKTGESSNEEFSPIERKPNLPQPEGEMNTNGGPLPLEEEPEPSAPQIPQIRKE